MKPVFIAAGFALTILGGCDNAPVIPLSEAKPATGAALAAYAKDGTETIRLGQNGDLVQRFCVNMTGAACAAGIEGDLAKAGFSGEGPENVLADAFAKLEADRMDGAADLKSTDEVYVRALYKVVLAREADAGGEQSHVAYLKAGNDRLGVARGFIQSTEFKALQ